ncbi:MAG: molecular chaperone DnaJ [Deltaproteobacteria bacterium]|nr:molecular chaperone DnaJ [Deltaproteobacteria bacterium]
MAADLYSLLGVERSASDREIKAAYKRLAMKHHPDRNPGDKQAEEKFKEVSRAFEVLGDKEKRKLYDEFGEEGLRPGFDPAKARAYKQWASRGGWSWRGAGPGFGGAGVDFEDLGGGFGGGGFGGIEDLLGGIFGGGGAPGRRRGARAVRNGQDVESSLELDPATAIRGDEVTIQLDQGLPDGQGTLRVKVPAGVGDGSKIRLRGKGASGTGGGPPGDLLITVKLREVAPFERHGDDLQLDLPITLLESVRGATIEVPVPEGGTIRLKVPPRSQSGDKLRLRGKGLPLGPGKGRSNLIVRLLVRLPDAGFRLEKLAEELEPLYEGDLRAAIRPA